MYVSTLRQSGVDSGVDSIPSVKVKDSRHYVVIGFNEFLKELYTAALADYHFFVFFKL